jgi:hypothetical protein
LVDPEPRSQCRDGLDHEMARVDCMAYARVVLQHAETLEAEALPEVVCTSAVSHIEHELLDAKLLSAAYQLAKAQLHKTPSPMVWMHDALAQLGSMTAVGHSVERHNCQKGWQTAHPAEQNMRLPSGHAVAQTVDKHLSI